MPAQRILFVKLSSLGDVIHHMPAVTDLARHLPDAHVAWAVEEAYAELVRLHPAVDESIAIGLRGLRARPRERARWKRAAAARRALAAGRWDRVIDTQGLIKSAMVARAARARSFGFDSASAREPLAAWLYHERVAVPRALHAVERNRRLVAAAFGYEVEGEADYGLEAPPYPPAWAPRGHYAVMLHAASRADKQWPDGHWVELARNLAARGYATVFPGGSDAERIAAGRLALLVPGALAAPEMDLWVAATLIAHASLVVGVDTGLTHLGVALGRRTVGIYRATEPRLTGLHGANGTSLGGPGREPTVAEVAAALEAS
ncbi:MAG TPA: lipopolysaccharide heptosyltransferase I [Usitatibacter sp.]|nr:lipopolysaccharide heptosyltransferase I [Usitatibacter sp.]